jgi:hypothetical protein
MADYSSSECFECRYWSLASGALEPVEALLANLHTA